MWVETGPAGTEGGGVQHPRLLQPHFTPKGSQGASMKPGVLQFLF